MNLICTLAYVDYASLTVTIIAQLHMYANYGNAYL